MTTERSGTIPDFQYALTTATNPPSISTVSTDIRAYTHMVLMISDSAYDGTKYLIGKGKKNIAFVGVGKDSSNAWGDRYIGYEKAMQEAGMKIDEDLVYFYLAGNACNIYTTMNGRTLEWISRMRCCNKAQWEIRGILNEMVAQASKVAPLVGEGLGPYCKVMGYCPEGKDSCKR